MGALLHAWLGSRTLPAVSERFSNNTAERVVADCESSPLRAEFHVSMEQMSTAPDGFVLQTAHTAG